MTNYQADLEQLTTEVDSINHVEVIENVIDSLEQDDSAMVSHPEGGGYLWKFKYGSVEVYVRLTGTTDEDTLTVWAEVLKLPVSNELGLMRKLLEMNCSSTLETCFGIIDNKVVVLAQRTLEEISPGEVSRLITIAATIADNHDELLQAEFSAQ